jgi:hypothetical protein
LQTFVGWLEPQVEQLERSPSAVSDAQGAGSLRDVLSEARNALSRINVPAQMPIIERGARAEYLELAGRNPLAIVTAAALYALGLYVVVLILRVQTLAVIDAAGWASWRDLLVH